MLCCGVFAVLAAMALGAWRLMKRQRRLFLALAAGCLAAGPVAALAMGAAASHRGPDSGALASIMRSICGDRRTATLESGARDR